MTPRYGPARLDNSTRAHTHTHENRDTSASRDSPVCSSWRNFRISLASYENSFIFKVYDLELQALTFSLYGQRAGEQQLTVCVFLGVGSVYKRQRRLVGSSIVKPCVCRLLSAGLFFFFFSQIHSEINVFWNGGHCSTSTSTGRAWGTII